MMCFFIHLQYHFSRVSLLLKCQQHACNFDDITKFKRHLTSESSCTFLHSQQQLPENIKQGLSEQKAQVILHILLRS